MAPPLSHNPEIKDVIGSSWTEDAQDGDYVWAIQCFKNWDISQLKLNLHLLLKKQDLEAQAHILAKWQIAGTE